HIDERAAAFFALGLAKATRRAVAVLGTSGTAVANFTPAVVEAREGRTPLVVLTADRPPELRDRGAPQTIDQDHLYGRQVKWYAELPAPEESAAGDVLERHLRGVVDRAVAIAMDQPAGPVHLNLPYREPIVADGLANIRLGPHDRSHVVACHDAIVRSEAFRAAHPPDLVLRFGGTPTSKALLTMLQEDAPAQIAVDDGGWNEPTVRPVTI